MQTNVLAPRSAADPVSDNRHLYSKTEKTPHGICPCGVWFKKSLVSVQYRSATPRRRFRLVRDGRRHTSN